jgi:putative glutamine amidotransferase
MRVALTTGNVEKIGPYDAALRLAGLEPVHVMPKEPISLAGLDGLVLTGGSDVSPARYGQPLNGSEGIDVERDQLEIDLLAEALAVDLPVLAICRGVQVLNVAHGGSLIQHLATSDVHQKRCPGCEPGRHPTAHGVEIAAGSRLARIIGPGTNEVNSRHHQAADRVGAGLVVAAVAADGVIEGLERSDRTFVVGVQWHPEDRVLVSESDRKLFEAFAEAVARAS